VTASQAEALKAHFGERLQQGVPLAPYTSARIGGPAEYLLTVRSAEELSEAAKTLWERKLPFRILGGGSNVLVADRGVRGVVVLNRAKAVRFRREAGRPILWAESGASLGAISRRAVDRGWSGMEWAVTVPGTVGGAVVGNAGAHGGDIAGSLEVAKILQRNGPPEDWTPERLSYGYRESWLKRNPGEAVVLSAQFLMEEGSAARARSKAERFLEHRRRTQPGGASWGSMFKNPEGDFAGRLIEAVGLKGIRVGDAQVSDQHANFFMNIGGATAEDALTLIKRVQARVRRETGVELELEVELLGAWGSEGESEGSGRDR
jgi:UDP-N-acetylmuramate dehydrogenase